MSRINNFRLDKANGKLMGVCAGIAEHMGWDVTFVRVGVVLATLVGGFPWTIVAYLAIGMLAKPAGFARSGGRGARLSTREIRDSMTDIDRRMAEVESYVTSPNQRLAREIEELR